MTLGGQVIVIGAPVSPGSAGAAYVFERDEGPAAGMTVHEVRKLTGQQRCGGRRIRLQRVADERVRTVVVGGAPRSTIGGSPRTGTGAAYVFEEPLTGWADMQETQKLLPWDFQGLTNTSAGMSRSVTTLP